MDINRLGQLVGEYVDASIAPSTAKVYATGQRRYLTFCEVFHLVPLPLRERNICLYAVYLAESGLQHSSIKNYLSAIRRLQIVWGMGDPFGASWPLVECTLKGIKMRQAKNLATRPRTRLPITPSLLRKMRKFWEERAFDCDHIMLWAACCMCFFGFLRSGEVTVESLKAYDPGCHLSVGDVALDSLTDPKVVQVRIKASKTDPFRKGVTIFLGRTGDELCPVAAVTAYLAVRGETPGAFFKWSSGVPLSREMLVKRMRVALQSAGVDVACYSGHSFRIGAATTAAAVGMEDSLIRTLGRWESTAYQLYIRVPREKLVGVSSQLVRAKN